MIKTLVVAAALTVGLAGDAVAQQAPPAPPAHHLPPHHPLPPIASSSPAPSPSAAPSFGTDRSGTDAVAIGLRGLGESRSDVILSRCEG